jgi:ABC-type antimicrobial peptide transport system permease subunit
VISRRQLYVYVAATGFGGGLIGSVVGFWIAWGRYH